MKIEDINQEKNLKCTNCNKQLAKEDTVHYLGDFGSNEVEPTCEECHNKLFGEDHVN